MTKVWCVRSLNNYNGKKKYSTDYHTSYTIGRIQLVDYTRDRASHTARRTIPHIEYELNEDYKPLFVDYLREKINIKYISQTTSWGRLDWKVFNCDYTKSKRYKG